MRVNDSTPIQKPVPANVATLGAGAAKAAEKAGAASNADSVRLSTEARELAASAGRGVFDVKKVAEIKAAIADGSFKVDASKIADGLIDSVKEMAPKRKQA